MGCEPQIGTWLVRRAGCHSGLPATRMGALDQVSRHGHRDLLLLHEFSELLLPVGHIRNKKPIPDNKWPWQQSPIAKFLEHDGIGRQRRIESLCFSIALGHLHRNTLALRLRQRARKEEHAKVDDYSGNRDCLNRERLEKERLKRT
jgi:hypothetical protein